MLLAFVGPLAFAAPDPVAPVPDAATALEVNRNWRGLGLGYDNGLWGSGFGQSIKLDVPFGPRVGQFLGVRVRGLLVHTGDVPIGLAGAELFGRGPVWAGVVRVYGGAGAWMGGVFGEGDAGVAWGGHSGVEVALTPRNAVTFEVGGQAPATANGWDGGASVMAGTTMYFGGLGK